MSADVVTPAASRNSPCPCGSGRRYKDCHGSLGAPTASSAGASTPAPAARRSSYRAPALEWQGIADDEADRLGALMERALAQQLAGKSDDAARLYREVLRVAPRTHDALHMLGVVELGAGNLEEAERLIVEARTLRAPYQTIDHNLQLVQDAIASRQRALPEELCEQALPLMVELAMAAPPARPRPGAAAGVVHVIGRVGDGGWLLERLAALLAPWHPTLWATDALPFATIAGQRAIGIDAESGAVPQGGIHVFAGVALHDVEWLERADADRVVVVCTPARPSQYLDQLRAIARDGARAVDLVFTTPGLAERFGGAGSVLPLPIALPSELPARGSAEASFGTWPIAPPPPFVAGVVGQDGSGVEEARSPEFLARLAQRAGVLAIYDPGRLRYPLGGDPAVRCIARTPGGLERFLGSLDCFVHRVRPWFDEGDGRPLVTAMALGVPVLCPRTSVFAADIRDRVDGLIYGSEDEALEMVGELNRAPAWARSLASAARERSVERLAPAALARRYGELVLGAAPASRSETPAMHVLPAA